MIGFLCNSEDVVNCYTNSFKPIIEKNISIVFFTINNIDLNNRKVRGIIASSLGIKKGEFKIPKIVFNFSKQCKKVNIKKLKLLCEIDEIEIINETNKFNQIMIMEILSSFRSTKRYILNYNKLSKKEISINHSTENSFLVMPKVGSSFNKMIYIDQMKPYIGYEEKLVQSKITTRSNKSLIIKYPKLKVYEDHLFVARTFVQKSSKKMWKYLYTSTNLNENIIPQGIINELETVSIKAVNYINNYIPSLGICFIDFVFGKNMKPYFLHFGGWDKQLLYEEGNEILHKEFCENLIQCYEHYASELQED